MAGSRRFLPPEQCEQLFPFHIGLDRELCIVQLGQTLARVLPQAQLGQALSEQFRILRPQLAELSLAALSEHPRALFLVRARALPMTLRGQFVTLEGEISAYFIGSPWVTKAEDLGALGLSFSDFAIHDPLADLLVLIRAQQRSLQEAQTLASALRDQRNEVERTAAVLEVKLREVKAQRDLIHELSTPVIRVWDEVVVLPIVGPLDNQRAELLILAALDAVSKERARVILIDLTGVANFDEGIVVHLGRLTGALRLLGSRCGLVGISPVLAAMLAASGSTLDGLSTFASLADALHAALVHRRGAHKPSSGAGGSNTEL